MILFCNPAGVALIKSFERCFLQAYPDPRGIPTIGWGATGPDIHLGLVWTQVQCDDRFDVDILTRAETPLNRMIFPSVMLTENQFSALCSLCYNIGEGNFAASTALATMNAGDLADVPAHIALWDEIDHVVSDGLVRRRAAEIVLWNTP